MQGARAPSVRLSMCRLEQEVSERVADVIAELIHSIPGIPDEVVDCHCGSLLSFSYYFCTTDQGVVDSPVSLKMIQGGLNGLMKTKLSGCAEKYFSFICCFWWQSNCGTKTQQY